MAATSLQTWTSVPAAFACADGWAECCRWEGAVRRGGDVPLRHGCCGGAEESRLANYFAVEGKKVAALTAWIILNMGFGVWAIVTWLQSPERSQPPRPHARTRAPSH